MEKNLFPYHYLPVFVPVRVRYIGPAKDIYTNPKNHPSYYENWKIEEVKTKNDWLYLNSIFARATCVERATGVNCAGWHHFKLLDWEIISI